MKIGLTFLCFFATAIAFGQQKEFIVLQNGDTLFGAVNLHNKMFIVTNNYVVSTYRAIDVKKVFSRSFKFNTVVPCVLHVYVDRLVDLKYNYYTNMERDTVMVLDEILSTPKMNLYFGTDNNKQQYYFYKTPADSLPVQLYINYSIAGGLTGEFGNAAQMGNRGSTHIEVQKGYVNQLRLIMGNCKKITEAEWELLDYRSYSLKSIIKKFNKCK